MRSRTAVAQIRHGRGHGAQQLHNELPLEGKSRDSCPQSPQRYLLFQAVGGEGEWVQIFCWWVFEVKDSWIWLHTGSFPIKWGWRGQQSVYSITLLRVLHHGRTLVECFQLKNTVKWTKNRREERQKTIIQSRSCRFKPMWFRESWSTNYVLKNADFLMQWKHRVASSCQALNDK